MTTRFDKSGRRPGHRTPEDTGPQQPVSLSPVVPGPPSLRLAGPRRPEQFICHDPFGEWVESILEDKNV